MASHIPNFFKPVSQEAQQARRNLLRRILLEALDRRELLAADLAPWEAGLTNLTSFQSSAASDLVFTSVEQERQLAPYDITSFLDRTVGGTAGSPLTERPWFQLIEESYDAWAKEQGLAFSFAAGMSGEGEGGLGLQAEGEAGGPRLLSVAPNSGAIFSFNDVNQLTEAPTELVLRFDASTGSNLSASSFAGIRVIKAGGDGAFGDVNDTPITPGYIGFGDSTRIVVLRFASTLEDDLYRVELNGNPADPTAVRNTAGLALQTRQFDSTPSDLTKDTVDFDLELGAQIIAVVPQPVDRLPSGALDPKLDTIRVYFNNDPLDPVTAENPAYYQLILTQDTVQPTDDIVRVPDSVVYSAADNLAELKFTNGQLNTAGTYRLRVGSRESAVPTALTVQAVAEANGNLQNALALPSATTTGSFSTILSQQIITTNPNLLPLDYPGSNFEPGHRDIQDESHVDGADESPQISTVAYNFALNRPYGLDAAGRPLNTSITPEQMQRVREIFDFYSETFGADFVETESSGLTVVVGDTFPNGVVSAPGGVIGIAGNGLAIMDGAEAWNNSFAADFFETAMHEIGHLLGLGHTYDLPFQTIMGSEGDLINPNPGLGLREWVYPGDQDIIHGQRLFRPDNRDVDSYRFTLTEPGRLKAETIAENLLNSSNLDTHLTLLRGVFNGTTLVDYEIIASNDNSTGSDSFLEVDLEPGTYFVSVTAKGNEDFNPLIPNTGSGGFSEGAYQLRVDFESSLPSSGNAPLSLLDTSGTPLDGDGNGLAGGDFDFWFRTTGVGSTAKTVYVDKSYTGPIFDGSAARPFNNLDFNNSVATRPVAQRWPANHLQAGDVIRVVGSIGKAGDNLTTTTDNLAYEIGRGGVGNAILSDGLTLEVPQGVTLMVDAGSIFKLQGSRITAGSLSASIDKSFSAVQVLGTPEVPVYFTSYRDQALGNDTNPLVTVPGAGDWGGIDFHNDVDRAEGRPGHERQGIFLNYVSHADLRYGGGQITVSSPSPTVNPINLSAARPTLLHNTIRFSADAAIAADPNSFEETRFTEPRYQLAAQYSPDYSRVGPDIRGNTLLNNSTNGLFVRTLTAAGAPLTTLDVAARFNDTDIVHTLGENLVISGQTGGAFIETTAPNVQLVQTQRISVVGGTLTTGTTVRYKVTAVDRFGVQGLQSAATPALTMIVGSNAVRLNNLPVATGDFVSRRLWRSTDGVNYVLVAELDGDTTTYTDSGKSLVAVLADPNATSVSRARPNARLQIDPGIIVKSTGARIEAGVGATLIAEGTSDAPVIFTSRQDDRYGAGGTFDTNSDFGASNPSAGDWSGLVARHLGTLSLDNVLVTHAGGVSSVAGGFAGFSAVEVHQSDARIAKSRFESNGSGTSPGSGSRDGRGPNDASVVFVVGSQPVIYGNTFVNNSLAGTAAISINANAMNSVGVSDGGRQTGRSDRSPVGVGNVGPLVEANSLLNNGLNGIRVRGETLTTESIWDDTDIVHVLQSEILVPDLNTYGGLTLRSKSDEGLVVKLGSGAGITALGRPLDITDRIGGSVRVVGTPGFPVVMTSINDDTVGAGFDPNGRVVLDTNNDLNSGAPVVARPGDWRSVRIEAYANDRNVNYDVEFESDQIQDTGTNDLVNVSQNLGGLAASLDGGDENLRLGFSVDGSIAAPQDLDVYSFSATSGTMVWIDLDRTSGSLDAVVELIDASGQIIALSNNSLAESAGTETRSIDPSKIGTNSVMSLEQEVLATPNTWVAGSAQDLYSVNPLDAGLRLILPGATGSTSTYYLRVRSSNLRPGDNVNRLLDQGALREGLSSGNYRMQVRLQQSDESPGSTVRYADIRFATFGIEAFGMPGSSPLLGQNAEVGDSTGASSVSLGNIANSDRGSVSASGTLGPNDQEDFFTFSISRDSTQSGGSHISTVFDIDYADGFGRPDTTLWVFNENNELVLIGTDSNIADDRAEPGSGAGLSELTNGSLGTRDPYIGAAELPDGNYTVVVSTQNRLPISIQEQFQNANPAEPNVRVEPIDSVSRLIVERFGAPAPTGTFANPTQVLFQNIADNFVEYNLADVTTYVTTGAGTTSNLVFANAMTGAREANVGGTFARVNDSAMSPDGRLVGFQIPSGNQTDANSGQLLLIDSSGDGATAAAGNSGIQTFTTQPDGNGGFVVQQRDKGGGAEGDGIQFNGLTYHTSTDTLMMFGVGSRGNGETSFDFFGLDPDGNVIIAGTSNFTRNIVYKLDPTTGAAINPDGIADRAGNDRASEFGAGTQKVEFGRFVSTGTVTGLAEMNGVLYGVASNGDFFRVNGFGGTASFGSVNPFTNITEPDGTPVAFTGLTRGPRNLEDGRFNNVLFGITANGTIFALDTTGNLLPVFPGLNYKVRSAQSNLGNAVTGIEFSPLDVNLWHVTQRRNTDAGHGRTIPFDNSQRADAQGGNSLAFGFENPNNPGSQPGNWSGVFDVPAYYDTYNLPGGAQGAFVSDPLDLRGYGADDLPMLYFNYFLATEGSNSDINDSALMRDALRVYAGTEDGNWVLLTTNNTAADAGSNRTQAIDEFDNNVNGNFDAYGNPLLTQETFDAAAWRQARVSLASVAGQSNVRLRFEFSTGGTFRTGNPLLGGVELIAVAGSQVSDADSFTVAPIDQVGVAAEVFELEMGLVLNLPSGAGLISGVSQLVIDGTTLTYSLTSNTGSNIRYTLADTPATIAQKTATRLQQLFPGIVTSFNTERPNVLNVAGLPDANHLVVEIEGNNTIATAQDLDAENWSTSSHSWIANSKTLPHLTVAGTGDDSFDYYSFTATAGSTAIFDVDAINFDSELFLYDTAGNLLATNDDSGALDAGSWSNLDSLLTHTFATAGTFVLAVGQFNSIGLPGQVVGSTPPVGGRYQLHFSVANKVTTASAYDVLNMAGDTIQGLPGVTPGHIAVDVNQGMTAPEVRDSLRATFAATFNDAVNAATATAAQQLAVWPFHENTIRLYRYDVTDDLSGLGLTTSRVGDFFGVQDASLDDLDQRAQLNNLEGVYIDDIIVGFAERGEMVFEAQAVPTLDRLAFADSLENPGDLFGQPRIEEGRYQLIVRTAADYGTTDGDELFLTDPPGARTFDTNDRLSQQFGIQVNTNAASQIVDGRTFTLGDGIRVLTFEYDVTLGGPEAGVTAGNVAVTIRPDATANEIALAIRDAVNSPESRAVLRLSATVGGEMSFLLGVDAALSQSPVVELHGNASTSLNAAFAFPQGTGLTALAWGQESGFGEDLGDGERVRAQGQVLLVGNTITNSSQFGILTSSGNRNQAAIGGDVGNRPYPGAPIAFPTDNVSRLAPGVVIMNNVIASNSLGGVRIVGDASADAPIQIARVLNNTIFGNGSSSGDTGLSITGNASPTVLNNIFASLNNGVAASAGATAVLGANVFQSNGNNSNVGLGSFPEVLAASAPLFTSTTNRRFYLASGSRAIDSSLEALQERPELTQVKNPLGLPLSPMLAPDLDVTGQRRVDDPTVNTPAGLGGNVFKDRGAVDRSDLIGLSAQILQPQDNDSANTDADRNFTYITVDDVNGSPLLEYFSILMQDSTGIGPDPASVVSSAVTLTENGRLLQEGVDYVFGYNANSRTLRLTPVAGIWRNDSVYQITLANEAGHRLNLGDGDTYADGQNIVIPHATGSLVFELDDNGAVSANAIALPFQQNTSAYELAIQLAFAINSAKVGISARPEGSGSIMVSGAGAITTTTSTGITAVSAIQDLAQNVLVANRPNSLTQFTIVMRDAIQDFGDADGINVPTIVEPELQASNGNGARHALLPVDYPTLALGLFADADANGQPSVTLDADDNDGLITFGNLTGVTQGPAGPAVLQVPGPAGLHLQTFTITDTVNRPFAPITFEFRSSGPFSNSGSTIVVNISTATSADDVADAVAAAVNLAVQTGRITGLAAIVDGARISLGGTDRHLVDLDAAPSVARVAVGNVDLVIPTAIAQLAGKILVIQDGVGNSLTFEINPATASSNIPVVVDLSSAGTPNVVAMALANAINQQVALRRLSLGGAFVSGDTLTIAADDEDGVVFNTVLNSASNPAQFTVTATAAGMLDAWIDWNGDGDFDDSQEKITEFSTPVHAGANVLTVKTPANAAIGFTTARFRLSALGDLLAGGVGVGGEVEDHVVEIVAGNPPVTVGDSYNVNEDEALTVSVAEGVLANDTDPDMPVIIPGVNLFVDDEDPSTLAIEPFVNVSNGTLVLSADGSFSYTPNEDFNGSDFFVYYATDGRLRSNQLTNLPTTVTIIVAPVNDAPVANDDTDVVNEDEEYVVTSAELVANDFAHPRQNEVPPITNEENQVLTLVSARILSEVVTDFGGIPSASVLIASKPGQNSYGLRINVVATDLGAGALPVVTLVNDTLNVSINSNTSTPTTLNALIAAINGSAAASSRVAISLSAGSNGTTVLGSAPAIPQIVVPPSGGSTPFIDASGALVYRPAAHYNSNIGGPVLIEVTIEDDDTAGANGPLQATSTLTLTISAVNDSPEISLPNVVSVAEDAGAVAIDNFLTSVRAGAALATDEAGVVGTSQNLENQQITYRVTALNADPSLFVQLPTITPTTSANPGQLTFELATNVTSQAPFPALLVEVVAVDNGIVGNTSVAINHFNPTHVFPSTPNIYDGVTLTVVDTEGNSVVFELEDSANLAGVGATAGFAHVAISYTSTDTTLSLSQKIAAAVSNPPAASINKPVGAGAWAVSAFVDNISGELHFTGDATVTSAMPAGLRLLSNNYPALGAGQTYDGATFTLTDANGDRITFEFNDVAADGVGRGNVAINYDATFTRSQMTAAILAAVNNPPAENIYDSWSITATQTAGLERLEVMGVVDLTLSATSATVVNPLSSDSRVPVFSQRRSNESAPQTFTIVPELVNDAPEFTITQPVIADIQEDQGVITVPGFITDARPGPLSATDELAFQDFIFTLEAFEPAAFSVQPALTFNTTTNSYDLTFTTNQDVNSQTGHDLRVRVIMQDDGGVRPNSGDVDTTTKEFELVVDEINDAPTFDHPTTLTVDEDQPNTDFPDFATFTVAPDTARDETTDTFGPPMQLPIFTLVTDNDALFATLPTIDETGQLSFVTAPHKNGQAVVVVTMQDNGVGQETGNGDENRAVDQNGQVIQRTFTINVTPINDPPEFEVNPFVQATSQEDDGFVTLPNFLINLRNGPLQATDEIENFSADTELVNPADLAKFTSAPSISTDGTLTFETAADVNGSFTVRVRLVDEGTSSPPPHDNVSEWQTFTINVTAINDRPTFELDSTTLNVVEDVGAAVITEFAFNLMQGPVTAVDELTQTYAPQFEIVSNSASELFDVAPAISTATGNLTFTTRANKNGKSVVVVRLRDSGLDDPRPNNNASALATFTISVNSINDAPEFTMPTTYASNEDAGLVSVPSFVTGIRRGPVGADDESSQTLDFEIRTEDVDGNLFTIEPTISVDGALTYQTAPNINSASSGPLRVWVRLVDSGDDDPAPNSNGSREPERLLLINVLPVNDPPVPDGFLATGTEDTPITILAADVLAGDAKGPTTDEDSQILRMTQIERTSLKGGRITPVFSTGPGTVTIESFTYTPPADLVGQDTFLYVVTDDGVPPRSGTGTITISLGELNDPPQFTRGSNQTVLEDSDLVTVANWATDILAGSPAASDEQLTQTVSFTTQVSAPDLFEVQPEVSPDGTLTFKPSRDATGTAIVRITAVDSFTPAAQSAEQTFTITITPINDAPVFTAGSNVAVSEDSGAYAATWATNVAAAAGLLTTPPTAIDEQNQVVDFTVTVDRPELFSIVPTVTSRTASATGGELRFTPSLNAFGTAVVTVRAVDRGPSSGANVNSSAVRTFTITINSVNDAPTGVADTYSTNENSVLSVPASGVLGNDTDVDLPGDSLAVVAASVESSLGAIVNINANGSFTYDPSAVLSIQRLTNIQSVVDTFTYVVRDASGLTSTPVTVSINVAGVDDAPVAVNDRFSIGVGQRRFVDILENDTDVDSQIDVRTIAITQQPIFGSVIVSQTGVVEYIGGSGFRGIDTFAYTVRDSAGNVSNEAFVEMVVNNAPVASNDTTFTFKNTPVNINVLANDSDIDGSIDPSTVEIVVTPSPSGTAEVLANGTIQFTPATNFSGQVQLSYVVSDNLGTASNVANVLVRVQNSLWQNPRGSLDVNNDTNVSPIDILLIINYLNSGRPADLPVADFTPPPFVDTSGDERVTPFDILLIVNYLNQQRANGEGEGVGVDYSMMVTPMQMIEAVGAKVVRELEESISSALFAEGESDSLSCSAITAPMLGFMQDDDEELPFLHDDEQTESIAESIDEFFGESDGDSLA